MWSCVLLTDAVAGDPVTFSAVTVVPAGDTAAVVEAIGRLPSGHVLVAAPATLRAEAATAGTVTAGRWPDLRLATLVAPHAPLALLSALALARATTERPALGVRLTEALLHRTWSGAWTPTVTKLESPSPSLAQHARSLLPGSGFLLRQWPEPAVLGAERHDDVPDEGLDRVLLAEDGVVPGEVTERLARRPGVVAVRHVRLPGRWNSVYGTDRAGQVALVPADPSLLLGAVSHHCRSCGLEQPAPVCPFCHVLGVPAAPPATVRQADPMPPTPVTPLRSVPLVEGAA